MFTALHGHPDSKLDDGIKGEHKVPVIMIK